MLSVSSRICTRIAMSISNDYNHYTVGTSKKIYILSTWLKMALSIFAEGRQWACSPAEDPMFVFPNDCEFHNWWIMFMSKMLENSSSSLWVSCLILKCTKFPPRFDFVLALAAENFTLISLVQILSDQYLLNIL